MPLRPLRPLLLPRALGPLHSETPVAGGIECDTRGSGRSEAERWDRQPEKWSLQWMTEFSKELDALDLCNCEEVKRCFLPMFDLGHRALLFPPKPRKPPNFLPGCPGSAGSEQVLRKGQWHAPHQRDFDLNRLEESWQKYTFFATNTAQEGTGS